MTSFHHVTIMTSSCHHHAITMPSSCHHSKCKCDHWPILRLEVTQNRTMLPTWWVTHGLMDSGELMMAWWWHGDSMMMAWWWHDGNMMKWCHHFLTVYVATCMLTNTIKLVSSHSFLLIPLPTFSLVCLYTSLSNIRSWILRPCSRTTPPLRSSEGSGGFSAF